MFLASGENTDPPRRRFDFFPPMFCLPTPWRREQLYKNICRHHRVEKRRRGCPLAVRVVTRSRWRRKKEGQGLGIEAEEKACLLRMRPKNRALKAPRLLETLGATFSIGVWHGKRRDNAPRGCHECQYFHYFNETSPRFRKPFEKRSADLFLSSFLPFFPPSILFFCDVSPPPRGETVPLLVFFRLIFRGYFSTIETM